MNVDLSDNSNGSPPYHYDDLLLERRIQHEVTILTLLWERSATAPSRCHQTFAQDERPTDQHLGWACTQMRKNGFRPDFMICSPYMLGLMVLGCPELTQQMYASPFPFFHRLIPYMGFLIYVTPNLVEPDRNSLYMIDSMELVPQLLGLQPKQRDGFIVMRYPQSSPRTLPTASPATTTDEEIDRQIDQWEQRSRARWFFSQLDQAVVSNQPDERNCFDLLLGKQPPGQKGCIWFIPQDQVLSVAIVRVAIEEMRSKGREPAALLLSPYLLGAMMAGENTVDFPGLCKQQGLPQIAWYTDLPLDGQTSSYVAYLVSMEVWLKLLMGSWQELPEGCIQKLVQMQKVVGIT